MHGGADLRPPRLLAAALLVLLAVGGSPAEARPGIGERLPEREGPVERLRAGAAHVDITPDPSGRPVWLAGFGQGRRARGVHDPIGARALVVDDGRSRVALCAVDLIGLFPGPIREARARLDPAAGVDHLVVASLHNHEGPDTMGLWGPSPLESGVDPVYLEQVVEGIARAVERAARDLAPVRLRLASFETGIEGFQRDSRPPEVVADRGLVCRLDGPDDGTVATLVGWHAHPEAVGDDNDLVSSDFPHALRRTVEDETGGVAIYLSGALGGLMTPLGVAVPGPEGPLRASSFAKAEALGRNVARRALAALARRGAVAERPAVRLRTRPVAVPVTNPHFVLAARGGLLDRTILEDGRVRDPDGRVLAEVPEGAANRAIRSEVGVLVLGPAVLLLVPGEIYPEIVYGGIEVLEGADHPDAAREEPPLARRARALPGVRHVFPVGLAGDELGYLVPRVEWDEEPPWLEGADGETYGEINACGPDAARAVHEGLLRCLEDLERLGPF